MNIERLTAKLLEELDLLHSYLDSAEVIAPAVSKWSVGEQIEHLLFVDARTCERISNPSPSNQIEIKRASLLARLPVKLGFIPRGKVQAPEIAIPKKISKDALRVELALVVEKVGNLPRIKQDLLDSRDLIPHPRFGGLIRKEWLRFLEVHQHHHIKIIQDILRAN